MRSSSAFDPILCIPSRVASRHLGTATRTPYLKLRSPRPKPLPELSRPWPRRLSRSSEFPPVPGSWAIIRSISRATSISAPVSDGAGALPLVIPALGDTLDLDRSGRATRRIAGHRQPVQRGAGALWRTLPAFRAPCTILERDATTLPLIRAALAAGVPVLAICRGIQELNVALGGSLHQRVQELPGKLDHRADDSRPVDGAVCQGPFRRPDARRAAGADHRQTGNPGKFDPCPGDRPAGRRPDGRGGGSRRPDRSGERHRRARLRAGGAVASRMALLGVPGQHGAVPGVRPSLRRPRGGADEPRRNRQLARATRFSRSIRIACSCLFRSFAIARSCARTRGIRSSTSAAPAGLSSRA